MYQTTLDQFAELAAIKARLMRDNPLGFMIAAAMAGAYVGIGIILIFSLGQLADPAWRPLVMGLTFGIALTLVTFAGAELFTGHTMIMPLGLFSGKVSLGTVAQSWIMTWVGNLIGAVIVAYLFYLAGGGQILKQGADLVYSASAGKMSAAPMALMARGILCNWLVCLAIWMSQRTKDDTAKAIIIFWCLLAFVASGYEHSIANMTVFALALLGNHPDTVTLTGAAYNLFWVTLGNIIAGLVFVAGGYWAVNGRRLVAAVSDAPAPHATPAE